MSLGCLTAALAVQAAPLEQVREPAALRIDAEPDREGALNLRLSDRLRLTLIVEGTTPTLPVKLIDSPEWDVQTEAAIAETVEGKSRWRQAFLIAPRHPGTLTLTPLPLTLAETTVEWTPVTVNVTTTVGRPDVKELRDVLPPEPAPPEPPLLNWLLWTGGVVAVGVLLLLGVRVLPRLLSRPRKPLTPAEEALRELERIESLALPVSGEYERYHTLVADAVRMYVEKRYGFHAPRQTTDEFLRSVQDSSDWTDTQRRTLREFLERCDVVKFAGASGDAVACTAVGTMAAAFIAETAT